MNKKISRLLSIILVLMLCMAVASPAWALPLHASNLEGGVVEIDKELQLKADALVPAVEFSFTLSSVSTGDMHGFEGYKGILTGVKISGDTTATTLNSETPATINVNYAQTDKTGTATAVRKGMLFDFTSVDYPNPGVYRYTVKENNGDRADITYDTDKTYYIDVYVVYNETDKRLELASVVVSDKSAYELGDQKNTTNDSYTDVKTGDKKDATPDYSEENSAWVPNLTSEAVFENPLKTCDLTLSKTVSGNQGSRTEYFDFTLSFTGVADGTYNYTGPGTTDKGTIKVAGGAVTEVTGPAASNTTKIKLKDGESIVIKDLPYGAKYTIGETYGDYTPSVKVDSVDTTGTDDTGIYTVTNNTGAGLTANNTTVAYTNDRSGTIPTGILLTIAPFVVLMLVGLAGIVVILKKKSVTNK